MNIAQAKQLEDLKEQVKALDKKYAEQRSAIKAPLFQKAQKEFADFFTQQGFELIGSGNVINAQYKNLRFAFTSVPQSQHNPAYIELLLSDGTKQDVFVRDNTSIEKFGKRVVIISNDGLEGEIKRAEKSIADYSEMLKELPNLVFTYQLTQMKKAVQTKSSFETFTALLQHLFNN